MPLAGFTMDVSVPGVADDPRASAILASLERNHPGGYAVGDIAQGMAAPAVIGEGAKVLAVPAELGTFMPSSRRYSMEFRAEEAADLLANPDGIHRYMTVIFPATSFTLASGPDGRIRYRAARADGEAVMYLAALAEGMHGRLQAALLVRQTVAGMRMYANWIPVVMGKDDVRAYLTDHTRAAKILMKRNPEFVQTRVR